MIMQTTQAQATQVQSNRTALILGANGGIGGELTRTLLRHGWRVRALARRIPAEVDTNANLEWVRGDALVQKDVVDAARDVAVIVHAVNPAKYHNWSGLVLPMLENTLAAAAASGARIVLPGTLYNYGDDAFPVIKENSPQRPRSRKGAIRVAMETQLREASKRGVRSLVVRAADFFGPDAVSSWFSQGIVMSGRPLRFVMNPGVGHLTHSWAYLPDFAEAIARLLDKERELKTFDTFHFRGHAAQTIDFMNRTCEVANIKKRILPFPWFAIRIAAPFSEMFREMLEMRYLWRTAVELDNTKLEALIGPEPRTSLDVALRTTLEAIGCIDELQPHAAIAA